MSHVHHPPRPTPRTGEVRPASKLEPVLRCKECTFTTCSDSEATEHANVTEHVFLAPVLVGGCSCGRNLEVGGGQACIGCRCTSAACTCQRLSSAVEFPDTPPTETLEDLLGVGVALMENAAAITTEASELADIDGRIEATDLGAGLLELAIEFQASARALGDFLQALPNVSPATIAEHKARFLPNILGTVQRMAERQVELLERVAKLALDDFRLTLSDAGQLSGFAQVNALHARIYGDMIGRCTREPLPGARLVQLRCDRCLVRVPASPHGRLAVPPALPVTMAGQLHQGCSSTRAGTWRGVFDATRGHAEVRHG
ncbi:hypothetical protein [Hyalangium sp.]|uniref:hypothetical protein n=1 Tax=Hyalangium sp. TaxID=2028555 RepID=UPI002D6D222E|nr:hypothetical protein [Hyalangium sp.]HYI00557.1 hypothetical protein [Hyalangium sp.]